MALRGVKVLELAGLAPGPFCGMLLSDFGATVTRIDKIDSDFDFDCLANGKKSIALNLKHKDGVEIFKKLCKKSDVVIETYRAGVMESLGLGPKTLLSENPKLIYARLSGFGQNGSLSRRAGHDINYVALSGLLSLLGRSDEKPFAPINALADFAGGGLTCAFGIVMALFERTQSGKGQVVDCSMVEGAAYLGSWLYRSQKYPIWGRPRGMNFLDGGLHCYEVYETKDGKYMSVGALEPKFYYNLLTGLGLPSDIPQFTDVEENKKVFAGKFLEKTQKEWCEIFDQVDACVAPVLSLEEASKHEHNVGSKTFVRSGDGFVPGPAPKMSRTPGESQADKPDLRIGQHTEEILKSLKYNSNDIDNFEKVGVVGIVRKSKM